MCEPEYAREAGQPPEYGRPSAQRHADAQSGDTQHGKNACRCQRYFNCGFHAITPAFLRGNDINFTMARISHGTSLIPTATTSKVTRIPTASSRHPTPLRQSPRAGVKNIRQIP